MLFYMCGWNTLPVSVYNVFNTGAISCRRIFADVVYIYFVYVHVRIYLITTVHSTYIYIHCILSNGTFVCSPVPVPSPDKIAECCGRLLN